MTRPRTIADVGEKALIRDLIKPLFNADDDPRGVGDDCAQVPIGGRVVLLSTDRVPADLIAFKLGILDHAGLGDYLARLNLSDIAACGGRAIGLLLNLGIPDTLPYDDLVALCHGVHARVLACGGEVLGGDITAAAELSISATSVGVASAGTVLTRRGARPGDAVFISRPLGVTPAAFVHFLGAPVTGISAADDAMLRRQFTEMRPMLDLGQALAGSGVCGACMDNTDGVGQSLSELAEASGIAIEVDHARLVVPDVVRRVAASRGLDPLEIAFDGGADFSLVGTLRDGADLARLQDDRAGAQVQIIGRAVEGEGVWLRRGADRTPLAFRGWNYFLRGTSEVTPR